MSLRIRTIVVGIAIVLAPRPTAAQGPPPPDISYTAAQSGDLLFMAEPSRMQLDLVAVEPFNMSRPVTGAPYSAEAVTEMTQTLIDGNRIEVRTSATISRDSRGRTRREQQAMALGPLVAESSQPIVTITDPTTHTLVTLDAGRRVAIKGAIFGVPGTPQTVLWRRTMSSSTAAPPPSQFTLPVPPPPGLPIGAPLVRIEGLPASKPDTRTESLGTRRIEGVDAQGTRTIVTLPAGAVGNQLPIEIVSERWFSAELQTIVETRRTDPRFGETTYRLTNISRAEPAADLFEIPSEFQIEDTTVAPTQRTR